MVVALFALSLVMILGGIAAVVQGFPYVRLESGLAMVNGGTTAASAGAVLLGIAVAVLQMKRLAAALSRRDDATGEGFPLAADATVAETAAFRAPALEEVPPPAAEPRTALAGTAGLAGIGLGSVRDLLGGARRQPALDTPSVPEVQLPLPDLAPPAVPGPVPPPAPGEPISPDEDLFAPPEDRAGHRASAPAEEPHEPAPAHEPPAREEFALRPALDTPPVPEPEASAPEPEAPPAEKAEPKPDELQVVGTYASGANTYVMFANGTIQADTPRGRFTFQSLDELKDFVDSGGEATTRGAA